MASISFEDVSFSYGVGTPFETEALSHITYEIPVGKITGIIGHTGSGKSTLVSMMNGLLKPTSGVVRFNGEDIWEGKRVSSKLRFQVGLVMQYPEYQLFEETVEKDIAFGPTNMGLEAEEIRKRVNDAVAMVDLDAALMDRSPFDLSGGQKRRAAIAGVMAMRPEVLILDEPAAGLDPAGRKTVFSGIKRYAETTGATVVIVSHSMEDMAAYCDMALVLSHGRVVMNGDCREIFKEAEKLTSIGLDIPTVTKITERLISMGYDLPHGLCSVKEAADAVVALYSK